MQHHREVIVMSIQETVDMFVDEIMEEHLNTLSDNQRKVLTEYSDTRNEQEGTNYHYLYLAGLKDGIQILKFLEVL